MVPQPDLFLKHKIVFTGQLTKFSNAPNLSLWNPCLKIQFDIFFMINLTGCIHVMQT